MQLAKEGKTKARDGNLRRWIQEDWRNLTPYAEGLTSLEETPECGKPHKKQKGKSVCRPMKKVNEQTPNLASSYSKEQIKKAVELKNKGETIKWELLDELIGSGISHKNISKKIRNITLDEGINDYNNLRELKYKDIKPSTKTGNKALDYFFFHHRLETVGRTGISFFDFINDKEKLNRPYIKKFIKNNPGKNKYDTLYRLFNLYFSSISSFKPSVARKFYLKHKPTRILDFTAGWGGRCLGAMSLDIDYIGFDTNKNLKSSYDGIIKNYKSNSNVKMYFTDSSKADFSKFDYDMVFTSPPYWMASKTRLTEKYENMPEYQNKDDFINNFIKPVIENTYKHLKKGGLYCLNIPIHMYDDVKQILGKADSKELLPIQNRNNPQTDKIYKEYIYIWKK